MSFPHITRQASYFLQNPDRCKTREGMVDLVCRDCQFWREDERDYECGAFKLLRLLVEKDILSVEEIIRAVRD